MTNNSGRKSSYTQQEADRICDLISLGHSWKDICKRVGRSYRTILRWKRRHSEFDVALSRARADSAYVTYEHIRQIERRMAQPEWIYDGVDEKGKPKRHQNPDWIDTNAGASIIRSMQWRMNHDNWAAFGDRRGVNISGTIEHQPVRDDAPEWLQKAIEDAPIVVDLELGPEPVRDVISDPDDI